MHWWKTHDSTNMWLNNGASIFYTSKITWLLLQQKSRILHQLQNIGSNKQEFNKKNQTPNNTKINIHTFFLIEGSPFSLLNNVLTQPLPSLVFPCPKPQLKFLIHTTKIHLVAKKISKYKLLNFNINFHSSNLFD